jgi:hypothetical protein
MAEKQKEKESKRLTLAKSGAIFAAYTQRCFLRVYPAYGIDKVRFSFVTIGSGGKGFDVYVDMDRFDLLADDILAHRLKKELANPSGRPFSYVTGVNGEKGVEIVEGRKSEACIHGHSCTENMYIPVSYDDLRILARYFKRTSMKHFEELAEITLAASQRRSVPAETEDRRV